MTRFALPKLKPWTVLYAAHNRDTVLAKVMSALGKNETVYENHLRLLWVELHPPLTLQAAATGNLPAISSKDAFAKDRSTSHETPEK